MDVMARSARLSAIFAKTVEVDGCLIWQGYLDKDGYARIDRRQGHRLAYELAVGPIGDGLTIDHLCFVQACVNPTHLRPLTNAANARRQREALKTHCIHGHEFTPENTYLRSTTGRRTCRTCQREAVRQYAERKKATA
ncbi:HNH endonuclease signature motif containing protein [uncultured Arthrobacter sp.]|uniref:HNH endonuclease signature motif containing protein n=1 Tax=uncultured Arthrobacter sp. TaxID=114050 RepID=UPI0025D2CA49|nr:HNH endonuclease signature motif containing protein [uncultured Arthrobacter sp.]